MIKKRFLRISLLLALAMIICLPAVALADININLNFDIADTASLSDVNQPYYNLFNWGGDWSVQGGQAVAQGNVTISLKSNDPFQFEGAYFASNGAASLTITGTHGDGSPDSTTTLSLLSPDTYSFNWSNIIQLSFAPVGGSGGSFFMDDFKDVAGVPLPPSALLLGSGLLGLVGLGWRRRKG
jgi:hypothetical protein